MDIVKNMDTKNDLLQKKIIRTYNLYVRKSENKIYQG